MGWALRGTGALPLRALSPQRGASALTPRFFWQDERAAGRLEADHRADIIGGKAVGAVFGDRAGVVAFGEAFACVVADQAVVVVGGDGVT